MARSNNLSVLYAFARSGGTLVNRCLGCMPGNLVLAEVNPHAAVIPVEQQAHEWLQLIGDAEISGFSQKSYAEKIFHLKNLAEAQTCQLIIRDWSSVNFLANVLGEDILMPSLILEQELYLQGCGLEYFSMVLTRNAADVYESITRTFEQFQDLNVEAFGTSYLKYAMAVQHHPIVHYEKVCSNPEEAVGNICHLLNAKYDESFISNFRKFENCTGDNSLPRPSRGMRSEIITPLKSNTDSPFYKAARANKDCCKADELFGYG